jgi:hypothetical protein
MWTVVHRIEEAIPKIATIDPVYVVARRAKKRNEDGADVALGARDEDSHARSVVRSVAE